MTHLHQPLYVGSRAVQQLMRLVSVASIWEVAIKHRLGKLAVLPVLDPHVIETAQLPLVHHDPFDRMLIAEARVEGLMAVSIGRVVIGVE